MNSLSSALASKGRGGDTMIGHLTPGDLIIPKQLQSPQLNQLLSQLYAKGGKTIHQYIAGDPANSKNPKTGDPEFGWWSDFRDAVESIAAPVLGTVGGVFGGPLGAAAGAGIGSAINGGSIGQDLLSAGTAGIGSEIAPVLGNAFASVAPDTAASLGIGGGANSLTDMLGQTTGGGSWTGAGTLAGGLSDASNAISGAGNSLSSALSSGSAPGTGFDTPSAMSVPGGGGISTPTAPLAPAATTLAAPGMNLSTGGGGSSFAGGAAPSGSSFTGSSFGVPSVDTSSLNPSNFANAAPSGVAGAAPAATGSLMSKLTSPSGVLNLAGAGSSLLSNALARNTVSNEAAKAQSFIAPYMQSGQAANSTLSQMLGTAPNSGATGSQYGSLTKPFSPADLTTDPGYNFNVQQGTEAMNRANAASGMTDSGAALKSAEQFGSGLADNTYNQAFQRNQAQNAQTYGELAGQAGAGLSAANSGAGIAQQTGQNLGSSTINAGNTINSNMAAIGNPLSGALSSMTPAQLAAYKASLATRSSY